MATRCPRCKQHDLALETFAVFRCADCGVMTIDGAPISEPEPPGVVTTGTTSFAAPPRGAAPGRPPRAERPGIIFTLVAVEVILCIAKALVPGVALVRVGVRASAVGAVVVGTRPAYRYALTALGTVILMDTVHLPALWPSSARACARLLAASSGVRGEGDARWPRRSARDRREFSRGRRDRARPRARDRVRRVLDIDVTRELDRVRVPVSYLAASRDALVRREIVDELRLLVPGLEVHAFDCAHLLLQLRPREAGRILSEIALRA